MVDRGRRLPLRVNNTCCASLCLLPSVLARVWLSSLLRIKVAGGLEDTAASACTIWLSNATSLSGLGQLLVDAFKYYLLRCDTRPSAVDFSSQKERAL